MRDDYDSAYPERYPHIFFKTSCPCCTSCWFNKRTNRCLFGGPFEGYEIVKGNTMDIEGWGGLT